MIVYKNNPPKFSYCFDIKKCLNLQFMQYPPTFWPLGSPSWVLLCVIVRTILTTPVGRGSPKTLTLHLIYCLPRTWKRCPMVQF